MKKLWDLGWSIYHKYEEVLSYLIFGFLAFVVNMAAYWGTAKAIGATPDKPIQVQIATAIAWIAAVIFAYWTNHSFVFKTKLYCLKDFYREFGSFISARLITYGMEIIIMYVLPTKLGMNDFIAKLVSNVIVIVSNYFFSKLWIFKNNEESVQKD